VSLISIRLTAEYRNASSSKKVLDDLRLEILPGEAVGLIGESGSGKSTLALALLRLLEWKGGSATGWVLFKGRDLLQISEREMRQVRGREIALVLQSAATSLNPALKIVTQFQEAWRAHSKDKWTVGRERALALLSDVNLPPTDEFLSRYPRQVSLGQAQRVLIALSLLHRPDLIIADEPTSALDTITQREVLELLSRLRTEHGMATLFISHDLLSVGAFCHRVAILKDGKIVEQGETAQIFSNPRHEYTKRLIEALPALPVLKPAAQEEEEQSADRYDPSLANLAKLAQSESNGKLIPFPEAPSAEAPKPSAVRNLPSQTKR
jgi:ABC-type dipeptide/oligopeptide/nickel transport system ATPase component